MSRSDSLASANAIDDNLGEEEDPQTQEDFREFALWLNSLDAERPHPANVCGDGKSAGGNQSTSGEVGSSRSSGGAASGVVVAGGGSESLSAGSAEPKVCDTCKRSKCSLAA